jgi:nickel-dependent lactate racemase
MPQIEFGVDSRIAMPDDVVMAGDSSSAGAPLADPREATRAALCAPLDYPPLQQVVVADDMVVLALEDGFVQPASVVAGVVLELVAAGVEPEQITVLRTKADAELSRALPTRDLPEEMRDQVRVIVHDPADRQHLALLNISASDEGIYLSRELVEADVVIPLSVAKSRRSSGYWGVYGALFPTYADEATQQRFCSPKSSSKPTQRKQRKSEVREAGWLLGASLVVQVVPGPGETLLHVVAGEVQSVEKRARELFEAAWQFEVAQRARLVVATMPGDRQQQSWANVARLLAAASRLVEDNGTIAICCDVRSKPGPSLRKLARSPSLEDARRAILQDSSPDALAAAQFVRTLQHAQVFMLSGLDEDVVQSLGLGYVASPDEVVRLAARHKQDCLLLQNAHQAAPRLAMEADE